MGLSHPRAVGLRILSLARTARPVLWAMLNRSESADHACSAVRNVCCDMSSPREMSFELSAAPPPKPAILRELIARDIRECARYGRRIDGETAKLEIQTDRANVEGRRDLIVDDVTSNWPVLTLRSTKSDAPAACNIRDAPQD